MRGILAALIVCLFALVDGGTSMVQSREIGGPYDMYPVDAPAHAVRHKEQHHATNVRRMDRMPVTRHQVAHVASRPPVAKPRKAPVAQPIEPNWDVVGDDDQQAVAAGALVGLVEGWADGIATAIQKAVGCRHPLRGNLVDCKTGASTSVSARMLPRAQCLLAWLDAAGYRIGEMGGCGARPYNASAHPTCNALDINQLARNRVSLRFPAGVTDAAENCGLVHGAVWSNPDTGHFEMPGKYGYVFPRGVRYARRHVGRYAHLRPAHRHHYAGA
jgi:hypothetical protein